jgi:hypothetical protein
MRKLAKNLSVFDACYDRIYAYAYRRVGTRATAEDIAACVFEDALKGIKRVRWQGGWVRMREAPYDMRYRVLGVPVPVGLLGQARRYTPHGPVIALDRKGGVALSVRWAGSGDQVDLARLLGIARSRSAAEVCAAFRALVTPTLNVVAADRAGHLRYQTVGRAPLRGFRPPRGVLPGDGRWEWQGVIAPEAMPAWEAPPAGFLVNANHAPAGGRYDDRLSGYDFPQDRAASSERLGPARIARGPAQRQNDVESSSRAACCRCSSPARTPPGLAGRAHAHGPRHAASLELRGAPRGAGAVARLVRRLSAAFEAGGLRGSPGTRSRAGRRRR